MSNIRLRALSKLQYVDPCKLLVRLRVLEREVATASIAPKVRAMRTNGLKAFREMREAAIFCYLIGERMSTKVLLAHGESEDYDFVARWLEANEVRYTPVQIKELVPETLNAEATMCKLIEGLHKYADSSELVVVVHVNRVMHFDPNELEIPSLPIAGLWAFAAIAPDQNEWALWGDLLQTREGTRHAYPAA